MVAPKRQRPHCASDDLLMYAFVPKLASQFEGATELDGSHAHLLQISQNRSEQLRHWEVQNVPPQPGVSNDGPYQSCAPCEH